MHHIRTYAALFRFFFFFQPSQLRANSLPELEMQNCLQRKRSSSEPRGKAAGKNLLAHAKIYTC